MGDFEMTYVEFQSDSEALDKLKSIELLTKTKTESSLKGIVYKQLNGGKVEQYPCNIIGFSYKNTPKNCVNEMYENLRVKTDNREFDINIDCLKEMQKKSWGKEQVLNAQQRQKEEA